MLHSVKFCVAIWPQELMRKLCSEGFEEGFLMLLRSRKSTVSMCDPYSDLVVVPLKMNIVVMALCFINQRRVLMSETKLDLK